MNSKSVGLFLKKEHLLLATAESCTAGLIASTIAKTAGSSAWLDAGFVVYSPEAKNTMLDVQFQTIETYNITSEQVAKEMALGAIRKSRANVAVSTTGVAGPSGGTKEIPVGTVCFAWAHQVHERINCMMQTVCFTGSRNQIRAAATHHALEQLVLLLKNKKI